MLSSFVKLQQRAIAKTKGKERKLINNARKAANYKCFFLILKVPSFAVNSSINRFAYMLRILDEYLQHCLHRRRKGSVVGGGTMASAEHEPIMGAWGQSLQWGPRAKPLVKGSGGFAP